MLLIPKGILKKAMYTQHSFLCKNFWQRSDARKAFMSNSKSLLTKFLEKKKQANHSHHSKGLPLGIEMEIKRGKGRSSLHCLMFGGHGVTSQTIPMRKVYKETEAGQPYI